MHETHTFRMRVEVSAQVPDEGEGLRPFEPCQESGTTSLMHPYVYVLAQGVHQKTADFFPKICSMYLVILHLWTIS